MLSERFGIAPRALDQYSEEDVFKAIRSKRGWEPSIAQDEVYGGWKAEIREYRTLTQSQVAIARDHNRMMALFKALRLALDWPTPEEEFKAFDEQTQSLMGLSATEFLERWHNNELTEDDPRVVHLLIAVPLGW